MVSTYEEYRQLRRDIGYDDDFALSEQVWNGCDAEAQENMLNQFRPVAAEARARRAHYQQHYPEDAW